MGSATSEMLKFMVCLRGIAYEFHLMLRANASLRTTISSMSAQHRILYIRSLFYRQQFRAISLK
jgi:hypothetical protein